MNRDEKNRQTRQKIIASSMLEFGDKSFSEASLNSISSKANLSKGIIYHYFKSKDDLFLVCIKECFDSLTDFLTQNVVVIGTSIELGLESYFTARIDFFCRNPLYFRLFCTVVKMPPAHLIDELAAIKSQFDALNISMLSRLLDNETLRMDLTKSEAVALFRDYQDFVNTRFQLETYDNCAIKDHEKKCCRSLNIMLHGIIK